MQIFVAGTWSAEKAAPFSEQGYRLGRIIAEAGFHLSCGPGTGIAEHVIKGYRSVDERGRVIFYLPRREEMEKVGEVVGEGADEVIETDFDYPMRNIFQIRASNALFIITGGDGSLEEAIAALADYQLPVVGLQGSGTAVKALSLLCDIYPEWKELLKIDNDIASLMEFIREKLDFEKKDSPPT